MVWPNKICYSLHLFLSDETARAAETARLGMTLDEAKQILNVADIEDLDAIQVTATATATAMATATANIQHIKLKSFISLSIFLEGRS